MHPSRTAIPSNTQNVFNNNSHQNSPPHYHPSLFRSTPTISVSLPGLCCQLQDLTQALAMTFTSATQLNQPLQNGPYGVLLQQNNPLPQPGPMYLKVEGQQQVSLAIIVLWFASLGLHAVLQTDYLDPSLLFTSFTFSQSLWNSVASSPIGYASPMSQDIEAQCFICLALVFLLIWIAAMYICYRGLEKIESRADEKMGYASAVAFLLGWQLLFCSWGVELGF